MRAIRKVAATDRAVICTIHQPSTYIFEMFDALLLLKKGGQPVFFGPLGENFSTLISYLEVIYLRVVQSLLGIFRPVRASRLCSGCVVASCSSTGTQAPA